ncbi:MAG: hypothetical protein EOM87_06795 [Clostridia bacterium]|nr:hypothetical protein [Clostridia bacterium]
MKIGLIGEKLAHSYSALVHREFGYEYTLREVAQEQLADFVNSGELDAFNVTIPYKKAIIPMLDELSPEAEELQSVNTVIKRNGRLIGYNTDYAGIEYMLKKAGIELNRRKVMILGSGGTSSTAIALAKKNNAAEIVTVGRRGEVNYSNYHILHSDAEVIFNATPVGMYPQNGGRLVDLSLMPSLEGVVEVIYNPLNTALILQAQELGKKYTEGLLLLVAQAKFAKDLFFNEKSDDVIIDKVFAKLKQSISNYVLVGMPSSGKSTKGRLLAERTNRSFVDTDWLIERAAGKSIEHIFLDDGEEYFRNLESKVIAEVTKRTSQVIATGGGSILRKENRDALKQNGIIIYIKRDIDRLDTKGRPLSRDKNTLEKLFVERSPIYTESANIMVNSENIEECVNQIEERINEYFSY